MLNCRDLLSEIGTRTSQAVQAVIVSAAVLVLLGAGDRTTRFSQIGHRMMCVCSCNQILLECNHVGCTTSEGMRHQLRAALAREDSDSLVEQGFVQKYGSTVLAAPTATGFDRAAYIVPLAALILGFGVIAVVIYAWKRSTPITTSGLRSIPGPKLEQFRDQARRETTL
jgi:cytochrome c-type biogenesis protein CcmH/NrfF